MFGEPLVPCFLAGTGNLWRLRWQNSALEPTVATDLLPPSPWETVRTYSMEAETCSGAAPGFSLMTSLAGNCWVA